MKEITTIVYHDWPLPICYHVCVNPHLPNEMKNKQNNVFGFFCLLFLVNQICFEVFPMKLSYVIDDALYTDCFFLRFLL